MKHTTRINAIAFSIMVKSLLDGRHTAKELAETTGLAVNTVRNYLNSLHRAGAIYISGWDQDDCGRYRAKQYTLGDRIDMKKPKPAPQKQKSARWRAKIRNIELINRMAA